MILTDTIAAVSSVATASPRIIVRLSGDNAGRIAESLLVRGRALPDAGGAGRRVLRIGAMRIPAWVYVFGRPRSPTGDDIVELHLPGSPMIASRTFESLLAAGARSAEPGEFTARAFFNGKLDLAQAEGVAAMIAAQSDDQLAAARALAAGELSRRLRPIVEGITTTLSLVEAGIDFVDEDITFLKSADLIARIDAADAALRDLVCESRRLEVAGVGPTIALAGRPNAGKSSLLNALAAEDRAVVADVPGTTRDALEAGVQLAHGRIILIDPAGLEFDSADESGAPSELKAIAWSAQRRARDEIAQADFVLFVRDATDDRSPIDLARSADLTVLTKADLCASIRVGDRAADREVIVSAKTGYGLADLRRRLDELIFGGRADGKLALATRHFHAVAEARSSLAAARSQAPAGLELAALGLRATIDSLGSITGTVTPDDVLGRVFATFCIGK
jgi:tRNA modification GTPase